MNRIEREKQAEIDAANERARKAEEEAAAERKRIADEKAAAEAEARREAETKASLACIQLSGSVVGPQTRMVLRIASGSPLIRECRRLR